MSVPHIPEAKIPDSALETVSEPEAARLLSIGVSSLRKLRQAQQGPMVTKIGRRIRYQRRHLLEWLNSRSNALLKTY
jgi:predicted DNA-binding transcriptional regulator AlpA